jgi:hypothetical protein
VLEPGLHPSAAVFGWAGMRFYKKRIAGYVCRTLTSLIVTGIALFVCCEHDPAQGAILVKKRREALIAAGPANVKPSTLDLSLNMPLAKVTTIANQFTFQIENAGSFLGIKYDATVWPSNLKIDAAGDEIYPISLSGNFRFSGHASGKVVEGNGTAAIRLGLKVGPDWCPVVEIDQPTVEWKELKAPAAVTFIIRTGLINYILSNELTKLVRCDNLKQAISDLWQIVALPIAPAIESNKAKQKALFLNLSPKAISLRDIGVANGRLSARVTVAVAVAIDQAAIKKKKLLLPAPVAEVKPKTDADVSAVFHGDFGIGPL